MPTVPDPAAVANTLADTFYAASAAVDDLRFRGPNAPSPELDRKLRDLADALQSRAQFLTAAAVAATLRRVQPDLDRLVAATATAGRQLRRLADLAKAMEVANALLSVGLAVSGGDPATVLSAVGSLSALLPASA